MFVANVVLPDACAGFAQPVLLNTDQQSRTLDPARDDRVCGAFVRGTITGRIVTCGYQVAHHGAHQGTPYEQTTPRRPANRTPLSPSR